MAVFLNSLSQELKKSRPAFCRLFFYVVACTFLTSSCKEDKGQSSTDHVQYLKINGKTMGTYYTITYQPHKKEIPKADIDSILIDINNSVSTYIPTSSISRINKSEENGKSVDILVNGQLNSTDRVALPRDEHFLANFILANDIYLDTDGLFDPTVMPLVNYWGFGYTPKEAVTKVDSSKVKRMVRKLGMEKFQVEANADSMICIKPRASELDFSGIAKGYAVDYLADHLQMQGVENLLVDIGGEVFVSGKNPKGQKWTLGLNTPDEQSSYYDYAETVILSNKGLASSGNYRNYHVVDGKKYGHEINPKTGFPELNDLLGVSVIAGTCMEADAVATALMIMGKDEALAFLDANINLDGILFFSDSDGYIISKQSNNFQKYLNMKIDDNVNKQPMQNFD